MPACSNGIAWGSAAWLAASAASPNGVHCAGAAKAVKVTAAASATNALLRLPANSARSPRRRRWKAKRGGCGAGWWFKQVSLIKEVVGRIAHRLPGRQRRCPSVPASYRGTLCKTALKPVPKRGLTRHRRGSRGLRKRGRGSMGAITSWVPVQIGLRGNGETRDCRQANVQKPRLPPQL